MGAEGSDIARTLRERRRALGLTRSRLADRTGISAGDLARWERGDGLPDAGDVVTLAEAIGLEVTETQEWLDAVSVDLTGPDVAVELKGSDTAPSDPFHGRSAPLKAEPPLLARIADRLARRDERKADGDPASVTPLREKRQLAPRRPAPHTTTGLVRLPREAAPLRSVFPEPAIAPYDPAVHVYSTAPTRYPSESDEQTYRLRRIRTTAVLLGLGIALWWATGSLWEGLGDVLDLLRTPTTGG